MFTATELFQCLVLPMLVSGFVALVGWWRKWSWLYPIAAVAGFLTAYAVIGLPKLPPSDGTDWLFWLAIPVALVGVVDARWGGRWGWLLGLVAGGVALVLLKPLIPASVTWTAAGQVAAILALYGLLTAVVVTVAQSRMPSLWIIGALAVVLGGAGVAVLSSHARAVGIHGIALGAALGPVALLAFKVAPPRAVAIVAASLLAGLLVSGRHYADLSATNYWVLLATPLLILIGAAIPVRWPWVRGLIAAIAVAAVVGAVVGPTALEAKRQAEADPYAAYK